MQFLDKYGWPVVGFKGRPVLNWFRKLIHTRKIKRGKWEQPKTSRRTPCTKNIGTPAATAPAEIKPHCCFIGCPKDAKFEIYYDGAIRPDDSISTDACTEHVGELLTDAPKHSIYPIIAV